MTQRKAILARTLSVAFLIPACLSFAQATEAPTPDSFGIRAGLQQLVMRPDFWAFVTAAGDRSRTSRENWLRIEMGVDGSAGWAHDVTFNYHVLIGTNGEALKPTP